jgi:hypothetical protein
MKVSIALFWDHIGIAWQLEMLYLVLAISNLVCSLFIFKFQYYFIQFYSKFSRVPTGGGQGWAATPGAGGEGGAKMSEKCKKWAKMA